MWAVRDTAIYRISSSKPDEELLACAGKILREGGLVAFPTETVYGLGASALDPVAVRGIFAAKGRPSNNPLIVHVASDEMLRSVVQEWPENAQRLAKAFWPGPLTLVVPAGPNVPPEVTANGPTVAVRWPTHPVALGLIRAAGTPLAAPSANRSTQLSPTRAEHVIDGLDGRIDMVLDGGPTADGIESTVVDATTDPPTLLRPGPINLDQLERAIGPVRLPDAKTAGPLRSPGLLEKHYAPRTPLQLVERDQMSPTEGVARLFRGPAPDSAPATLSLPDDPVGYATGLYAALHELDRLGMSRILVEAPPTTSAWLAIRDRLQRASFGN